MQTVVFAFARGSQANLKSKCLDYPKNQRSRCSPPTSFWVIFPFSSGVTLQGSSSDVGWWWGVFCSLSRNWEMSEGYMEGYCQAQEPHRWCQVQDSTLERGLGVGRVEVGVEGTAVTGDLATTVGITLLAGITCCGEVVSFLPWSGFGLGSCPKLWKVFVILQSNSHRNVCLKAVWEIVSDDLLGLPVLEFLLPIMAQRLGTFHLQGWGLCSIGVCSWFLT